MLKRTPQGSASSLMAGSQSPRGRVCVCWRNILDGMMASFTVPSSFGDVLRLTSVSLSWLRVSIFNI